MGKAKHPHNSKRPEPARILKAIEAGDTETGCTVHLVTADIDSGRILAQATVPILPGDTPAVLHARIKHEEHRILPQVLAQWQTYSAAG